MWENQHFHVLLIGKDIGTPLQKKIWQNLSQLQTFFFYLATYLTLVILFIFFFAIAKCMYLKVMIAAEFLIKKDWKLLKYP